MGKIKNNQKGFGAIAVLLILIILVVIGVVGWMVYKNHHKTAATPAVKTTVIMKQTPAAVTTYKTYTDPSNLYTVSYPSTWTTSATRINADSAIAFADPNLVELTPAHAPPVSTESASPNGVSIIAFSTVDTKSALKERTFGNTQSKAENLTINGYPAMYQQDIATSPTQVPSYTDDNYAVTDNGVTLIFDFREKQGGNTNSDAISFDASNTVPAYTALVKSVKFLN